MKRCGRAIKSQATTTERSHICVSQQYCWHIMIEEQLENLRQTNSPHDIFTRFAHYFQLNLDETCFLCNQSDLKVLRSKDKLRHEIFFSDSRFSITFLWVGSSTGMNVPVIFMEKGKKVHPSLIIHVCCFVCNHTGSLWKYISSHQVGTFETRVYLCPLFHKYHWNIHTC